MMPTRLLTGPIRLYRAAVSPYLRRRCRYEPSCSAYALEAIEIHGVGRGTALAVRRLARCHPFHEGGFDPVPPPSSRATRMRTRRMRTRLKAGHTHE